MYMAKVRKNPPIIKTLRNAAGEKNGEYTDFFEKAVLMTPEWKYRLIFAVARTRNTD
jgi:hypothetical protein